MKQLSVCIFISLTLIKVASHDFDESTDTITSIFL